MPCPYFFPVRRLVDAETPWSNPPRFPLGDAYAGACQADPSQSIEPTPDSLTTHCNFGYARGECERFPTNVDTQQSAIGGRPVPDAVRFTILKPVPAEGTPARGQKSGTLEVIYVIESACAPLEHGALHYDLPSAEFAHPMPPTGLVPQPRLLAQARAFVDTWLRQGD